MAKVQLKLKTLWDSLMKPKKPVGPQEIQVSYDDINLYPSVLLDKAIQVIIEFLQDDYIRTRQLELN